MATRKLLGLSVAALVLTLMAPSSVSAQQITRIAVIDMQKVLSFFSNDSPAAKDRELKRIQLQTEADRMWKEITELKSQRIEADKAGDATKSALLKAEIDKKTEALRDYLRVNNAALDELAKKIPSYNDFILAVYKQIQQVAESQGFSLVLDKADSAWNPIIWYSSQIDITDEVLQALSGVKLP